MVPVVSCHMTVVHEASVWLLSRRTGWRWGLVGISLQDASLQYYCYYSTTDVQALYSARS